MAEIKKYLSYDKLAEYDSLLKNKMAQDDELILDSAKSYADTADEAALESAKSYTDELVVNSVNELKESATFVKTEKQELTSEQQLNVLKNLGVIEETVQMLGGSCKLTFNSEGICETTVPFERVLSEKREENAYYLFENNNVQYAGVYKTYEKGAEILEYVDCGRFQIYETYVLDTEANYDEWTDYFYIYKGYKVIDESLLPGKTIKEVDVYSGEKLLELPSGYYHLNNSIGIEYIYKHDENGNPLYAHSNIYGLIFTNGEHILSCYNGMCFEDFDIVDDVLHAGNGFAVDGFGINDVERIIGSEPLETESQTVIGAINELNVKSQNIVDLVESYHPDWNQNDENAIDYVKNRTHWTESAIEVLPECQLESVNQGAEIVFNIYDEVRLTAGVEYVVRWNGTDYNCIARDFTLEGIDNVALGNLGAVGVGEITTEPFIMLASLPLELTGGIGAQILPLDETTELTISIMTNEVVHQLDEKFIPDSIARKDYVDVALENKANAAHGHDDLYYTESEVDELIAGVNTSITNITNGNVVVKEAEHATSADSATTATNATTAESATKATQDGNGAVIVDTYETKTDAAGKLTEAKSYADGKFDALSGKIGAVPDGQTVMGIISNIQENAYDDTELVEKIDGVDAKVATLVGSDANKSVRTIANEELAKQLVADGAQESLDTLAEIAAWIQQHPADAAAMNEAIVALQNKVDTGSKTVSAYVTDAIAALSIGDYAKAADLTALANRVSALETASATHALKTDVDEVSDALDEYKTAHAGDYTNAQIDEIVKAVSDEVDAITEITTEEINQLFA